jgi:hypothetical protein
MSQPINKFLVMPNYLSDFSNIDKYQKLPNMKQESLKNSIRIAFTAIALSLSIAIPSQAASVSFSGDTTNAATFNRPQTEGFEGGSNPPTSLSSNGTAVPYSSQPFFVDTTGIYNVTGFQNFLGIQFLYTNNFNPATPLANLLSGNDPFPDEGVSGFNDLSLTANNQYFLVTTGFDNTNLSFGTFTNTISGTGNITLGNTVTVTVPEPSSTPSIVAFAIAGTTLVLKRQIKNKKPKFITHKNAR